jgi:hypothetical protein
MTISTKINKSKPYHNDQSHFEVCHCGEPIDPFGICFHRCEFIEKTYYKKLKAKTRNTKLIKDELSRIREILSYD